MRPSTTDNDLEQISEEGCVARGSPYYRVPTRRSAWATEIWSSNGWGELPKGGNAVLCGINGRHHGRPGQRIFCPRMGDIGVKR
jgi:hypothetical protein